MKAGDLILVTGGCGFVGSNLVSLLIQRGYRVWVLDNLSRGRKEYLDSLQGVELVTADITRPDEIEDAFEDVDAVIHLAAMGSVVESVQEPSLNFQVNVQGTFNVLNACVKNGVSRLIFSSTGGALIGNATPPVNETSLPKPISPYGASKLCCESYCHAFAKSYGIETICLRFANVYGPNSEHKTGVINKFFQAVKQDEPFVIYGDGSSTRDYIHVSDLTAGIVLALEASELKNEVIHLASGREVSLNQLVETVAEATKYSTPRTQYLPARTGEVDRNFANYEYANQLLGFEPKTEMLEGLTRLWESLNG